MQESRQTDPHLNPLNSGKTRDDTKPVSSQFLINVVNIWRDWAPPSEKSSFDNHYTKHSEASLRLPHLGLSCKQICLKNEILWRFQKPSPFEVLPCAESQAVDKFITTFQSISKALRDPTGIFTLENLHKLIKNPQNEEISTAAATLNPAHRLKTKIQFSMRFKSSNFSHKSSNVLIWGSMERRGMAFLATLRLCNEIIHILGSLSPFTDTLALQLV